MGGIAFGRYDDSFSCTSIKGYLAEFISTLLLVLAGVGSAIAYNYTLLTRWIISLFSLASFIGLPNFLEPLWLASFSRLSQEAWLFQPTPWEQEVLLRECCNGDHHNLCTDIHRLRNPRGPEEGLIGYNCTHSHWVHCRRKHPSCWPRSPVDR